jgi:hypothetical protein
MPDRLVPCTRQSAVARVHPPTESRPRSTPGVQPSDAGCAMWVCVKERAGKRKREHMDGAQQQPTGGGRTTPVQHTQ